ncbi:MAG: DUF3185 family protein [Clostridiaceae bacterium]|nr:DUF3185 family protein [Clostridiaceae bacterium]
MKIFGGIILFLGVILSFFGYTQMNSLENQMGRLVGHNDPTGMIMVGIGVVMGIVGIVLLLKKNKSEESKIA